MQLVPHSPTDGVYPATDDYVHVIVAETLVSDWLVEIEVIAAG